MGVPKFYRWLSERYPCLSEVISDNQIPEFDNLYFDMNGIIHNCSHPDDCNVVARIPEEQIFRDIFYYIETLFGIICPKKVFFMAIDGVAPRAKMNQQRARRFMSAKNAEIALKNAQDNGITVSEEERFDSNCITPGTQFMANLHKQLQYFIQYKITTDPTWQGIRIYYSGHDCPGEGEHKIMDFIRSERSQPNYDPNTRHCLYGLDGDLIVLGACSHEPHMSLLREEVQFGRSFCKTRKTGVDGTTFHLLHMSLLREYLGMEFEALKDKISFKYDIEAIIDDWVLMSLLVGNDFIPHLPYVHIQQDGFDRLYATYIEILPQLDGYLNESGVLNLKRFEAFLKLFAKNDRKCFFGEMEDINYLESKRLLDGKAFRSKKLIEKEGQTLVKFELLDRGSGENGPLTDDYEEFCNKGAFDSDSEDSGENYIDVKQCANKEEDIREPVTLISASEGLEEGPKGMSSSSVEERFEGLDICDDFEMDYENLWTRSVNRAFKNHKRDYYREKLKYKNISKEELHEQAECYIRAIQWNLHYYYHGCCSWSWFYPHHYAPYVSDIINFSDMKMNFELNEPLHPFEQLLAVLPAASAACLPEPLQELMLDENSPIRDFYPDEFLTDLNDKKNDWEAVVLIPFIDEKRLLEAIETKIDRLTPEERFRNLFGPHLLYTTDFEHPKTIKSTLPGVFDDLINCVAKKKEIAIDAFHITKSQLVHGLIPGVELDIYFPGFPTTHHIPYTSCLREANICVFRQPSLKKSMVMTVEGRPEFEKDISSVAAELLGTEVHIDWPILRKGLVSQLWTRTTRWYLEEEKVVSETMNEEQVKSYDDYCSWLFKREYKRYGIEVCHRKAIVFVRRLLGVSFVVSHRKLVCKKLWEAEHEAKVCSLELIVQKALEDRRKDCKIQTIEEAFPVGCTAFFSVPFTEFYGCRVKVESNDILKKQFAMLKVRCTLPVKPIDFSYLRANLRKYSLTWLHISEVVRRTSLSRSIINRITGYIPMNITSSLAGDLKLGQAEKINIGLDLKNPKKNLVVPDYVRRGDYGWDYSFLAVNIILEYRKKFPEIFRYLENPIKVNETYSDDCIWRHPNQRKDRLRELRNFLSSLPSASCTMESSDGKYLDSRVIKEVERTVASVPVTWKTKRLGVKSYLLFRPELHTSNTMPDDGTKFELLDRVICVRPVRGAPYGSYGTVIGITETDNNFMVEVLFDKCYLGGRSIRGSKRNSCRLPASALIDITFGNRVRAEVSECEKGGNVVSTDRTALWGPEFYHPSMRRVSLPVPLNSKNKHKTNVIHKKMATTEQEDQQKKIILLKKKQPSITHLQQNSRIITADAHLTSETKLDGVLEHSDIGSCKEQAVEVANVQLKLASTTADQPSVASFESIQQPPVTSSSRAFGEFKTSEKDCEKRFEDLLKKLRLGDRSNKSNEKVEQKISLEHQEPTKLIKLENESSTVTHSADASKDNTMQLAKPVQSCSDSPNCQPTPFNFCLPTAPVILSHQRLSFPLQHSFPFFPQNQNFQASFTHGLVNPVPLSLGCRQQLKPGFCKVKLPNQLKPRLAPRKPFTKSCVNFPVQPQWHMQTTTNRFISPKYHHFPQNRQPFAQSTLKHQSEKVGESSGHFTVPSNMTPTQVIRKKVPPSSGKDVEIQKPSTSSMSLTSASADHHLSLSSPSSSKCINDDENASSINERRSNKLDDGGGNEHITPDTETCKENSGISSSRKSCSPDLDSIPELKVLAGTAIVPPSNPDTSPHPVPSSNTATDGNSQKDLVEKASTATDKKFRFLGRRKSRLAAKFN